jgi:hypothetical protein
MMRNPNRVRLTSDAALLLLKGIALLVCHEAVAQRSGQPLPAIADSSSVGYGCAWSDGVTVVGAVSGPHSGDLVTMKLGEVVGHHH